MKSRLLILATPVLAAAALAGPAHAADYCVHQGGACPAGSLDMSDDLEAALAAADVAPDADRIDIGPGTYAGHFQYQSGSPLEIVGAGRDATVLESNANTLSGVVLGLNRANVTGLRVRIPDKATWDGISAANGTIRDVAVEAPGDAVDRRGVSLRLDATLDDSSVSVGGKDAIGVATHPDGKRPTVTDSTISAHTGVRTFSDPAGTAVVRRSTIDAVAPVYLNGIALEADDVVLHARNASSAAVTAECSNGRTGRFAGDHLTISGHGADAGVLALCEVAGLTAEATIANSVVTGVQHALARSSDLGGTANVKASFSDLHATPVLEQGDGTTTLADTFAADPGFAADGVRPVPGSPLVDAGAPGEPAQAIDRDGNPRLAGARQDVGAFELPVSPSPVVDPTTPTAPGPVSVSGQPPVEAAGGAAAITDAALLAELKRTLRGRRGKRYQHRFLVPGTLRIKWIAQRRVIAQVRVSRKSTGLVRLRVTPTRAGRRILRRHGRLRVAVKGSFAPTGRKAIRTNRRMVLKRG